MNTEQDEWLDALQAVLTETPKTQEAKRLQQSTWTEVLGAVQYARDVNHDLYWTHQAVANLRQCAPANPQGGEPDEVQEVW